MAYRVVPEFKTSTRIKPLFAYSSFVKVCIGGGLSLLILTSHSETKGRMFWSSLAIFLQNESIACYPARTTSSSSIHKFGRLFFLFYVQFLDSLKYFLLIFLV
jgi:hypothetical protein